MTIEKQIITNKDINNIENKIKQKLKKIIKHKYYLYIIVTILKNKT